MWHLLGELGSDRPPPQLIGASKVSYTECGGHVLRPAYHEGEDTESQQATVAPSLAPACRYLVQPRFCAVLLCPRTPTLMQWNVFHSSHRLQGRYLHVTRLATAAGKMASGPWIPESEGESPQSPPHARRTLAQRPLGTGRRNTGSSRCRRMGQCTLHTLLHNRLVPHTCMQK